MEYSPVKTGRALLLVVGHGISSVARGDADGAGNVVLPIPVGPTAWPWSSLTASTNSYNPAPHTNNVTRSRPEVLRQMLTRNAIYMKQNEGIKMKSGLVVVDPFIGSPFT
ncbi:hypothetical protein [Corynebacterium macginleyi]|uniref:hypothetical protein n=1 Tax=Corynebacterium macginleyi TaxID=38290 RepID=UPI00190955C4|nr:hypothetical protein [Corynebacterium macginleyi]MBK4148718.1 hypothetical protein [Corynebacterium macginleyi]MBK4159699.1 hypothetical protein [Corynebacterium macginleyi]MBK4179118.1 hypothetical protein [Corynebacterium macginleyi]